MKKRVFTIVSMVVVAILYYFSISGLKGAENTNSSVSSIIKDSIFTNCIFNSPYSDIILWMKPQLNVNQNIDRYEELNFNSIQWYDGGSDRYGYPDQTLNQSQIDSFKGVLNSVRDGNLLGFYERSHLGKYAYGQRLIYEVSPMNDGYEVNNGFVYLYNMPETYDIDSGRTVNHLKPGVQDPGYLCKNIYENLQHSDLFDFRQNDKGTWFIKPVMRIPDSMLPSKKVVRIDVISFNGVRVDSIVITADNFNDVNGNYFGEYLEKYNIPGINKLEISGDTNSTDLNYGHHERWWNWDDSCKVDFRVFWYGECEIWFDKMIVDDEVANDLFDPAKQLSYINPRIQQEVQNFTGTEGNNSFFIDEILMSQYPCMKYVFEKMRLNPDVKISIALTDNLHIKSLRNDDLPYTIFYDLLHPDFIQHDTHKFEKYASDMTVPKHKIKK